MEYYLWLGFVAVLSFLTGFVFGKPCRSRSEINSLIEQIKWLPIVDAGNRNTKSGMIQPFIELEGGIYIKASCSVPGSAYIQYRGIGIGVEDPADNWVVVPVNKKTKKEISTIFHNRIAEYLLESSTKNMLCEHVEGR